MNARTAKALRKNATDAARQTVGLVSQPMQDLHRRTKSLEEWAETVPAESLEILGRGFWGRLKWLILGR